VAGIGAPIVFIALWAVFGSPKAPVRLSEGAHLAFAVAWFGMGALALVQAGRITWGVTLAALYAINMSLARVWR
jgi:hypothetical protein